MSVPIHPKDTWAAGDRYEPYVGRWSRKVAAGLLDWLDRPPGAAWLDVGCGTGALSSQILERARPAAIVGVDPSAEFIAHARSRIDDARVSFQVGDAQALPVESDAFDVAAAALVLNFVPRPDVALQEMARAVKPGGLVAAYVWDYGDQMQLMRHFWDAAVALNPAAVELDEGRRFPMCRPDALKALFEAAGLQAVDVRAIDVATSFRDFDDYWTPFLGGQGPAPGYAMSLAEADRDALRERIRASLPVRADGSIELVARAWAGRGEVSPRDRRAATSAAT
jgi:SAM-dependent methyltransferase